MTWKNFVGPVKLVPRRRMAASAIMYGLSLAVRFTSATGEEIEIPPQAIQSAGPGTIMISDGAQLFHDRTPRPAQPIGFPSWLLSPSCRAGCESPVAMPGCSAPP